MDNFLALFGEYDVLGAFLVNIELTPVVSALVLAGARRRTRHDAHLADLVAAGGGRRLRGTVSRTCR